MSPTQKKTHKPLPTHRQRVLAAAKAAVKIQAAERLCRACEAINGDLGSFECGAGVGKVMLGQRDELVEGQEKREWLEGQGWDCGVVSGGDGGGGGVTQPGAGENRLKEIEYGKIETLGACDGGQKICEPNAFVKEVTVVRFEDDGSRSKFKYEFVS